MLEVRWRAGVSPKRGNGRMVADVILWGLIALEVTLVLLVLSIILTSPPVRERLPTLPPPTRVRHKTEAAFSLYECPYRGCDGMFLSSKELQRHMNNEHDLMEL